MVKASPASIWKILSDPNLMELWNPKCIQSNAGNGPFGVGFVFDALFKFRNSPERTAECMIEEYEPNSLLTIKYSGSAFRRQGYAKETHRLISKRRGTKICQTIDFTQSEIPVFVQLIMKVISSVGHSVNKGPLDGIKELAEDEESQQINSGDP